MNTISAVVVLYNPSNDVLVNIKTYSNQVDRVYAIDNSERANLDFVEKLKYISNIVYIYNNSNLGIAAALNIAAISAIKDGYSYLLTMDQDSSVPENMVSILFAKMSDKVGIVAAEHFDEKVHNIPQEISTEEILFTMTSGNLLNLSAYSLCGKFLEELFIDHVDHEYCLRLNSNCYKVIKTNETFVFHRLGDVVKKKFLKYTIWSTNHSPVRLYYRFRNRFFVSDIYKKKFPEYPKIDRKNMFLELLGIYLYEQDLFEKTKMIVKGYIHYRKKKLGKFFEK